VSTSAKIRTLIADDHAIVRAGVRALLESVCEITGEASNAEEALRLAAAAKPDLILFDLYMRGMSGVEGAFEFRKRFPATKIIVLTKSDDENDIVECLKRAGALGYVLKDDGADELLRAVKTVRLGKPYVSTSIQSILLRNLDVEGATSNLNSASRLTRREREILKRISEGETSKTIAAKLGVSPKTVQIHREHLMEKLGARTAAEMIANAIRRGVLKT